MVLHSLSKFKSDPNFVVGAIKGLTGDKQLLAILAVSVNIPCRGPAKRVVYDSHCSFLRRVVEKKRFTVVVLKGDWKAVSSWTHRNLLDFRRLTRFSRQTIGWEDVLTTSLQSKGPSWENQRLTDAHISRSIIC